MNNAAAEHEASTAMMTGGGFVVACTCGWQDIREQPYWKAVTVRDLHLQGTVLGSV